MKFNCAASLKGGHSKWSRDVKQEDVMEKIERILVVNRTRQYCREEVRAGLSVARKYGARLLVLHLISNPVDMEALNAPLPYPDEHKRHASIQDEAREELNKLLRPEMTEFPIEIVIRDGEPVDEVNQVVKDRKIDLIVLLAQEQGRLEHMLFGQDNDDIIRSMPCSILLVKKEPEPVKW
jgi:nucleotide-binding universal stress UspA family protein